MFRTARRAAGVGAVLAGVLLAVPAPADDSVLKVKEGDKFPDFTLPATAPTGVADPAKQISLADLKGKVAVIAFYPKALTGG
jgi:hypothetical protein